MNGKQKIIKALRSVMGEGDASATRVYKGHGYSGAIEATGWWAEPFNQQPMYLGASVDAALEEIEQIASSHEFA